MCRKPLYIVKGKGSQTYKASINLTKQYSANKVQLYEMIRTQLRIALYSSSHKLFKSILITNIVTHVPVYIVLCIQYEVYIREDEANEFSQRCLAGLHKTNNCKQILRIYLISKVCVVRKRNLWILRIGQWKAFVNWMRNTASYMYSYIVVNTQTI